jgi:cob(I)alamin adenosyltransferase
MAKIYTKTGDKGKTSLIGGTRVPKYDDRIEAYGTVDELKSWVGLLRDKLENEVLVQVLTEIQDRLFTIESLLASDGSEIRKKLPVLAESDITFLEKEIDRMNESLPPLKTFILPGGHEIVSFTHITRTVCRRSERIIAKLDASSPVDPLISQYINRLSDYFFVLSRQLSVDLKAGETPWKPRV